MWGRERREADVIAREYPSRDSDTEIDDLYFLIKSNSDNNYYSLDNISERDDNLLEMRRNKIIKK